jgi:chemotaxis protein histidine kinase CheA/FixJ family two-component response regulator
LNARGETFIAVHGAAAHEMLRAGALALCMQADEVMARVIAALDAGKAGAEIPQPDDATRALSVLAGALALVGQHELAALVERLRRRILSAPDADGQDAAAMSEGAARLQSTLRLALERSFRGRPVVAADLLPAWAALAASNGSGEVDSAAPLVSLQADESVALLMPAGLESGEPADPVPEAERALLAFLRAAGAAERREAAGDLAHLLARVAADSGSRAVQRHWLVLHAYLVELAESKANHPARAKNTLVHLLRALRHRADPGLAALLAPLAREALFELAQGPVLTEAGQHVARAFRLAGQFSPTLNSDAARTTDHTSPADVCFIELLGRWIAAREAGQDGLGKVEDWVSLAELAAQSERFLPVAEAMRRLGLRWSEPELQGAAQGIAAAMLCLGAAADAQPHAAAYSLLIADVLERAPEDLLSVHQTLQKLAHQRERQTMLHALATACGEVLEVGERLLDTLAVHADRAQALSEVRPLLQALAGAARLLELRALPPLAEALLEQLDALHDTGPEDDAGAMPALAQIWVLLADEVTLLPWTADGPDGLVGDPLGPCPDIGHAGQTSLSSTVAADEPHAVDPLVAIFLSEAACLLAQLRRALPPPGSMQSSASPAEALHAAHTLAGCAATVGLPAMSRLAHALESLLAQTPAASLHLTDTVALQEPLQEPIRQLLQEALQQLDDMLAEFAETGSCRDANVLVERLAACTPFTCVEPTALPECFPVAADPDGSLTAPAGESVIDLLPTEIHDGGDGGDGGDAGAGDVGHGGDAPDMLAALSVEPGAIPPAAAENEELLAIFREEAADLLPQLEQALEAWLKSPDDRAAPAPLLRILHTLKGSARMAGQWPWGEALHRCETEVAEVAQLAPAAIPARLDALQVQFDEWRRVWSGPGESPPACTTTCQASPAEAASLPAPAEPAPSSIGLPQTMPALATVPERASASPLLRVRADALAGVADAVAALWIGHGRLADSVRQQRRAVTDLADNLARLRTQVRELEIDAESRIVSGATGADDTGFDPLEFDRYTRLHEITRMIAESAADLADLQRSLMHRGDSLSRAADVQARELRGLQSSLQTLRSQPFGAIEARLRHVLRQVGRESGREIELTVAGAAAAVDRALLDRLAGPLEHVLRNAVVHGIESPAERDALGKPRAGRITLRVLPSAAELRLELLDDGRGLDFERIRARASAVGLLVSPEEAQASVLSDLIFQPGFSTASEVTALAGRGIGLDAVRAELQALGGRIAVDSRPGQGCRFTISVPLSLATLPVLLVRAGRYQIGLLASGLLQLLQLKPGETGYEAHCPTLRWQAQELPLRDLGQLLGEPPQPMLAGARQPVAVLRVSERLLALKLNAVEGQRELVVKNPGPQLSQIPGLAGASVLGDGSIALIVDPFRLDSSRDPGVVDAVKPVAGPLVLVVDDSLTVRRASQRLLERHGYEVALARDGIEALTWLRERRPEVVLLDIEMPRMDGFELLAAVRDDSQLRDLPVVMITSRIADRHRQRARQLGASGYMGKPYPEEELISLLSGLCRSTSGEQHEDRLEKQLRSDRSEAAA